jgi:hypothetical protein
VGAAWATPAERALLVIGERTRAPHFASEKCVLGLARRVSPGLGLRRKVAPCLAVSATGYVTPVLRYGFPSIGVLWILVGVVVAAIYDYFDSLDTAGEVLSLVGAVVLWPILLFGFDIQIRR